MSVTNARGTSGNRKGFKVFSINTTVRNPSRNIDFLKLFETYSGKPFNDQLCEDYYKDLISNGIYRPNNISERAKNKYNQNKNLSDAEVSEIIQDNPQATGNPGRVRTQLRSLKDLGLLHFDRLKNPQKVTITALGQDLIGGKVDPTIVYTKIMIGLHANNPDRKELLNRSRPFLNTIFVINEVNKRWKELGHEPKGILMHEFAVFVLSMKDCNYRAAASDIINYRLKFKTTRNIPFFDEYLQRKCILPLMPDSLLKDYPDEVFRKFQMTGLIYKHGAYDCIYYDFSKYNIEKINIILQYYDGYKWESFDTSDRYYQYMENIVIPWEKDELMRRMVVTSKINILSKAKIFNIQLQDGVPLSETEDMLDKMFYVSKLEQKANEISYDTLYRELLILSRDIHGKSKFDDIGESLRLEFLLAVLIAKKYGTKGLTSNIIYDESGNPIHFAPPNKADIIYESLDGSFILEPTMNIGKDQQLNSETTSIVRHLNEAAHATGVDYYSFMIAPRVHVDVVSYFKATDTNENSKAAPVNISRFVVLVKYSESVKELCIQFDAVLADLLNNTPSEYLSILDKYKNKTKEEYAEKQFGM